MDEGPDFVLAKGVNRWHVWARGGMCGQEMACVGKRWHVWASSHMRRVNINMSRPKI